MCALTLVHTYILTHAHTLIKALRDCSECPSEQKWLLHRLTTHCKREREKITAGTTDDLSTLVLSPEER